MRKMFLTMVGLFFILSGKPGLAEETLDDMIGGDIGYQVLYYDYSASGGDEEQGVLHGASLRLVNYYEGLMERLEGEFAAGRMSHEGEDLSGNDEEGDSDNLFYAFRGLGGKVFDFKKWWVTLYTGLGYRYWSSTSSGDDGHEKEYRVLYSPVGLETRAFLDDDNLWVWGVRGEYDMFWRGWVKNQYSDVDSQYNDPESIQPAASGFGLQGAGYVERHSPALSFMSEVFVRYWSIAESDPSDLERNGIKVRSIREPRNRTFLIGLKVGILF